MASDRSSNDFDLCILYVVSGSDVGAQFALAQPETTLGRGGDQNFPLNDTAASRRHAIITRDGAFYRITDLGSSNGTLVNGARVDTALLDDGDEITIGNTRMCFESAPSWDDEFQPVALPVAAPPKSPSAAYRQIRPTREKSAAPANISDEIAAVAAPAQPDEPPDPFHEVLTDLKKDALLPPLPDLPSSAVPPESAISAPLFATLEKDWLITVGETLSEGRTELAERMDCCSGLAWVHGELVAARPLADFIDFIDPNTLAERRVELPKARGPGGLRAEADLQLEAVLAARDYRGELLFAFGAGTTPHSRKVVRMRYAGDAELSVVEARGLYEALLAEPGFATSTLNIEGAALISSPGGAPPRVRLLQRGNGQARGAARVTSATVDIQLILFIGYLERCRKDGNARCAEDLANVRRYDLGAIDGVSLAFTDGSGLPNGRMLYVAVAERCADAGLPGPNFGTVVGIIEADGRARHALLRELDGAPTKSKVAAVTVDDQGRVYVALQATEELPARLCRLQLDGVPIH